MLQVAPYRTTHPELTLGVSRSVFRANDPNSEIADARYKALRPKVLERASHQCFFCGLETKVGIEVHHLDCNHHNNSEANLKAADVFCHPVNHIGELQLRYDRPDGSEIAGGDRPALAWLEGLSQQDVNHLLRTIGYVMLHGNETQKAEAKEIYGHLAAQTATTMAMFGSNSAMHFAVAMQDIEADKYESRKIVLGGLKVLFTASNIKRLASKCEDAFKGRPLASWSNIYAQAMTEHKVASYSAEAFATAATQAS